MTGISFGIGLPVVQQVPGRTAPWERAAGPAEIVRVAATADRLGFAHVACSDHPCVPSSRVAAMGATWYDPVATLAHVGALTCRVELLTHVLVLPYRHPVLAAKSLATLDALSGGRLVVGVGSGHLKPEFATLGAPFETRGADTEEAIAALRALWTGEPASGRGPRFPFRDVVVSPRPSRIPPIWVGGNAPRIVRRAALHGEGWVPWEIPLPDLADGARRGREIRAEAGRKEPWEVVAPFPVVDLVGARSDAGALHGAAQVVDEVNRRRAVGVTRLHVPFASRDCDEFVAQLEAFASQVMESS